MAKKQNKKTAMPAGSQLSTQILVQPVVRSIHDIASWRTALRLADRGNRTKLYDMYEDILLDGVLSDAIDKRIDAVKDADLAFTINNRDVDVMYDLIDSIEFEELIGDIMLSKFWGVSVDEFTFNVDQTFSFTSIDRKHIRPTLREIAKRQEDERGISYATNDHVIQWGKDDDLGLLLKVAPLIIYKRGGFGDWAQFVELFGMPLRIGKYSSMDEASRRELIRAFETAGSAPYLVIPKETEASQEANASSGNGLLYKEFRQACSEEVLITILGQTMTTVDGSSLAQGEVHLAVQEKKHRADRRYVERMLNRFFVPLLINRGYPIAGGKFQFLDNKRELEVSEIIQLSDIMPIPQSYLHERYNIPLPKGDEPIARRQAQALPAPLTDDDDDDNDPDPDPGAEPRGHGSNAKNESGFFRRMFDFFVAAQRRGWASNLLTPTGDAVADATIKQTIDEEGRAYFNAELFRFTHSQLIQAAHEGFRHGGGKVSSVGFVYEADDDAYLVALEQNLYHFSASKTLAEMNELNRIFRESKSFEEFRQKAQETTKIFNETWLKTEYQTAVSVAESASTYRRLIAQTNVFPFWEYRTVGDDRVRQEHQDIDGLILPADDPRWKKIMPPNGWNCRCYIVPRMTHEVANVDMAEMRRRCDKFFGSTEWSRCEAQGFGINRADEAQIFTANQMYIHKFADMSSKTLEKITPREWGVSESLDTLMHDAPGPVPRYEGDPDSWFDANKIIENGAELLMLKDYAGRAWRMSKKGFVAHSTNAVKKRAFRTEYLAAIKDVAANPDEVWLGREGKDRKNKVKAINNFIMVKFYKDVVLAVAGKVEKAKLTLKTWYVVRDKSVRRGLLLRKKQ